MADSLNSIGSIAQFITSSLNFISPGISGNMVQIVDIARQYVSQYTNTPIGSNSIPENYQGVITNLALSDTMKMVFAGGDISLSELSVTYRGVMSPEQYQTLAESQLKMLGRHVSYARSLS